LKFNPLLYFSIYFWGENLNVSLKNNSKMAKQDTRGGTPKIADEQLSDILLVMDKKELSVRARFGNRQRRQSENCPGGRKASERFFES
jgi:hypothetical protein